jgi:hypothetical protein
LHCFPSVTESYAVSSRKALIISVKNRNTEGYAEKVLKYRPKAKRSLGRSLTCWQYSYFSMSLMGPNESNSEKDDNHDDDDDDDDDDDNDNKGDNHDDRERECVCARVLWLLCGVSLPFTSSYLKLNEKV